MTAQILFNIFGYLAIFMFGMQMMSDGLHLIAGKKMRSVLRLFAANRVVAVTSGTVVTAVIQSSAATTVMVIGFINAGLLSLAQAMGIIFGANIGTTVTAQLVAFDISWIIMPSLLIGLILNFIKQRSTVAGTGQTLLGLGFLFYGMEHMSGTLKGIANSPAVLSSFQHFDCTPVGGIIPVGALLGAICIGMIATMIIQSSSACSGVVIALGASGVISLETAVALIMGSNIGTTVTAQLVAITANRVAKQAALAHTLFNILGVLIMTVLIFIPVGSKNSLFFSVLDFFSSHGTIPRQIANAHTIFNIVTTLILIPFIPLLAHLCEKIIPASSDKVKYLNLEPHLLDTPEIALSQSIAAIRKMLRRAWMMVDTALNIYNRNDEVNQSRVKNLEESEQRVDRYQKDITDYLSKLMRRDLLPSQAERIPKLLHCTNDAERIGDHTAIIQHMITDFMENNGKLSATAEKEVDMLHEILNTQADMAAQLLENPVPDQVWKSAELYSRLKTMCDEYEFNHLKRLTEGLCNPKTGVFYLELISEIRKVSHHLANICERAEICGGSRG
jgi:Na/Pi-cotransporter